MMHLKMQKLLLVIKVYFWIIFTAHLKEMGKNDLWWGFGMKWIYWENSSYHYFFNELFIKTCHSSNLSQNKFLVIYWDLRNFQFYNTCNWFHSPVILPLNLTYVISANIFKGFFVLFYKHAYNLGKHAAIEFSYFYV